MKIETYKNCARNFKGDTPRRSAGASSPHPTALILIELLVVIVILAVLVALVVGVGMWIRRSSQEKQTVTSQKIVMAAIRAYYDAYEDYPPHDDGENDSGTLLRRYLSGKHGDDPDLTSEPCVKAAMKVLRGLPEEALPIGENVIKDGYGNPMAYKTDGGLGGGPVVISAGPDGLFGDDANPDYKTDNIRSDKQ